MKSARRVGRPDLGALAASVLGPLALYVATLPRAVVLEDDSLFLMAGLHLGVAHPPGYPLYTFNLHRSRGCRSATRRSSAICPARCSAPSPAVRGFACAELLRAS